MFTIMRYFAVDDDDVIRTVFAINSATFEVSPMIFGPTPVINRLRAAPVGPMEPVIPVTPVKPVTPV